MVWENTCVLGKEKIDLISSLGRTIAENILSNFDIPPFERSAMDEFAIIAEDTNSASEENPVFFRNSW